MKYETIDHNNTQFAYIIRNISCAEGKHFFGSEDDYLQLGVISIDKGDIIDAHYHNPRSTLVTKTQEVIIVIEGELEVCFYDVKTECKVESKTLFVGDVLVILAGGHSFSANYKTKIVEVKQGPYEGIAKDKQHINIL